MLIRVGGREPRVLLSKFLLCCFIEMMLGLDCSMRLTMTETEFEGTVTVMPQYSQMLMTLQWRDYNNHRLVVQGTPTFQGVIPGGQSFSISESNLSTVPDEGYGFDWPPSVRIGTTVILVGSDNSGAGTGGSGLYIISQGSSQSCLDASSPSSTPGSPAGRTYPTSTSGAGVGDGNSTSGSSGSLTVTRMSVPQLVVSSAVWEAPSF